ncbi:MAG: MYXO-CTERM sorting domain-containing protein [Myxococcaceae bacterium]
MTVDAGTGTPNDPGGCGCTAMPSPLWLFAAALLLARRRRHATP